MHVKMKSKDWGHERGRQGTGLSVDHCRSAPRRSLLSGDGGRGRVPYVARCKGGHKIGRIGLGVSSISWPDSK